MANVKKMTKRDYFTAILAKYELTADEKAFIEHELDLLARKNATGSEKKMTAAQIANEAIRKDILAEMEDNRQYTITEMIKEMPSCAGMNTSKVVSLLRPLIAEGKVERTESKGKALFCKVAD